MSTKTKILDVRADSSDLRDPIAIRPCGCSGKLLIRRPSLGAIATLYD